MPLTAEQVEDRRKRIGASDVPVILGLSRHKTAKELYEEKNSILPAVATEDREDSSWGHALEQVILKAWGSARGFEVLHWALGTHKNPSIEWATATPDGACTADPAWPKGYGIECKNRRFDYGWGPSGTQEIPPDVEAQVRWSMFVFDTDVWGVSVLIGGNEHRHYLITRDKEWEEWVFPIVEAFREGHYTDEAAWKPVGTTGVKREATTGEKLAMSLLIEHKKTLESHKEKIALYDEELRSMIGEDLGIVSEGYTATLSPVKGRKTTDWEAVAWKLTNRLKAHGLDGDKEYEEAVDSCVKEGKPYRKLLVREVAAKPTNNEGA